MGALTSDLPYLFDLQMQQSNETIVLSQIPKL
jgi:hypothetical protein